MSAGGIALMLAAVGLLFIAVPFLPDSISAYGWALAAFVSVALVVLIIFGKSGGKSNWG